MRERLIIQGVVHHVKALLGGERAAVPAAPVVEQRRVKRQVLVVLLWHPRLAGAVAQRGATAAGEADQADGFPAGSVAQNHRLGEKMRSGGRDDIFGSLG